MIKKICSVMLLCATILMASCQKDDEATIGVSEVKLDKTELSLVVNTGGTLVATILPDNAEDATVAWSSSDKTVATVSETGVVLAIKAGETTITATAGEKTATCKVTVIAEYIEVNGIKVAVGNLVADGANGAKIGAPTDKGLFFQFGSLVGWSETGDPTVVASPVGYTGSTTWDYNWEGDLATENVATGTGDPCKHYLKGTWRLPANDEYRVLFNNVTNGSYANSGGWSWDETNKSATNSTKNLTFPASGSRHSYDGTLEDVGIAGQYWNPSPDTAQQYILFFTSSNVQLNIRIVQAFGLPVRCVRD